MGYDNQIGRIPTGIVAHVPVGWAPNIAAFNWWHHVNRTLFWMKREFPMLCTAASLQNYILWLYILIWLEQYINENTHIYVYACLHIHECLYSQVDIMEMSDFLFDTLCSIVSTLLAMKIRCACLWQTKYDFTPSDINSLRPSEECMRQ